MRADAARPRLSCALIGVLLLLGGCAHGQQRDGSDAGNDAELNAYPTNYKADILAAMHVYLNDPTRMRDGGINEPALKTVGSTKRYVACLRFNPRNGNSYAGAREVAAVFVSGRFDRFIDAPREQCAGVNYAPFPDLEKLSR